MLFFLLFLFFGGGRLLLTIIVIIVQQNNVQGSMYIGLELTIWEALHVLSIYYMGTWSFLVEKLEQFRESSWALGFLCISAAVPRGSIVVPFLWFIFRIL